MRGEHLHGKVHSTTLHVLVDVSEDVDELHLNAEVNGVKTGRAVLVSVDLNQNQSDGRGHLVAVRPKFVPRLIVNGVKVVLHPFDHGFKIGQLNGIPGEHVLEGHEDWVVVFANVLLAGALKFEANVNEGHHPASVLFW